mmetsp:Transcript_24910/g.27561  ORF Transcript_24910/g.27561 Transcript_24910/m.27561 type:complete len:167 (+) Transcript_24910:197-697(+)
MIQFLDFIHYIQGVSRTKPHTFMHIVISSWMLWLVIELHPSHFINFYWMLIRLTERIIKHVYNIYINMGLRFELVWLDYFRFSSFYVLYPLEVICSYIVIYFLYPHIRGILFSFEIEQPAFTLDYGIILVIYILISIPNFLNTLHYLHNKKVQLLKLYADKESKRG